MKKIALIAIMTLLLASCGTKNETEETTTSTWTQVVNDENTNEETSSWEVQNEDTSSIEVSASGSSQVEISDIVITNEEDQLEENEESEIENQDDITEEEILKDIDALIDEIINSTENEGNTK